MPPAKQCAADAATMCALLLCRRLLAGMGVLVLMGLHSAWQADPVMPQQQVKQPHQAQGTTAQQLTLPAQHPLLSPWQEGLQLRQQPVLQCLALGATKWQGRAHRGLLSAYRAKHGRHVSGADGGSGQLLWLSSHSTAVQFPNVQHQPRNRYRCYSLQTVLNCDSASTCTDDHNGCSSGNTITIIGAAYRSVLRMSLQLKPQPHQAR